MNKILIIILLTFSGMAFAQVSDEEFMEGDEAEALFMEDNFEQEMFMQKQEEASRSPGEINEEMLIEEEVYDVDSEYIE